ncbi:MAG: hypothetical protein ACREB3_03070, partial [Burkholderiales bacterium]
ASALVPANGGFDLTADMLKDDEWRLRRLIERHMHYTNSRRAKEILDDWDRYVGKFVKVMPHDFRRVLEEKAAALTRTGAAAPSRELANG